MLISNNLRSLHFWRKENLVKNQKVSKSYENECGENFLSRFMFLLTTKLVKNVDIWARIYFNFLKRILQETWNSFNTEFQPQ